jgi:hypothetical protein
MFVIFYLAAFSSHPPLTDGSDDGVRELLPSVILVSIRLSLFDGQAGVQEKDALETIQRLLGFFV